MAWTAPMTAVASTTFTAAQFNQHVRDNLNETAPGKATAANQYPVATGTNAIAMRAVDSDVVDAILNTSSTTYTGTTPAVTITTGTKAYVHIYGYVSVDTNSQTAYMTFDVSGATTAAANDNRALAAPRFTSAFAQQAGMTVLVTGLTAGSNIFECKYRVTGGTGTFDRRRISIQPF